MPERIQRKRTKGWRMPPNAVYVGRPSRWGNDFRVVPASSRRGGRIDMWAVTFREEILGRFDDRSVAAADAVERFRRHIAELRTTTIRTYLADCDLACWCPLDQPCHANVLLNIANSPWIITVHLPSMPEVS